MTTKRVPIRRSAKAKLTPETIAIWRTLREIEADRHGGEWEPLGRRREYLDLTKQLCHAVGLWWGYTTPLGAKEATPPEYMRHNELQAAAWREAWKWRCVLKAAARG